MANHIYINKDDGLSKYACEIPLYFEYKKYGYFFGADGLCEDKLLSWFGLFKCLLWIVFNKKKIINAEIECCYGNHNTHNNTVLYLIKHLSKFKKYYLIEYF